MAADLAESQWEGAQLLSASSCSAPPLLLAVDKPRRFLRLQSLTCGAAQRILAGSLEVAPDLLPSDSSFSGMLLKMADSARWVPVMMAGRWWGMSVGTHA